MNTITKKSILAIVPARSGSKGLPNKNIRLLDGTPLINYSIKAALGCSYISKVMVTTDSEEYKKIAEMAGAEVPFLRPSEIADDKSSMASVISHVLNFYKNKNEIFDTVILLQPTSPLRTSQHLTEALDKYYSKATTGDETLVSVVKAPRKMRWLLEMSGQFVKFCFEVDTNNPQRQSLGDLYLPNGAIYISNLAKFSGTFYTEKTLFYEMSEKNSIDIDSEDDFHLAELWIKSFK